ncbi:hypothetical protein B0T10DRAFT_10026 [Thelonectria olida]|uniref:Uncharacterized protein n=1 Tax=Thelonectria olida TaxID=1576542 RepID=A0A9P8WFQ3_9HYPO|nr:hypothetical protein B0T10DRAFT_10026 [Thelonectria olida]
MDIGWKAAGIRTFPKVLFCPRLLLPRFLTKCRIRRPLFFFNGVYVRVLRVLRMCVHAATRKTEEKDGQSTDNERTNERADDFVIRRESQFQGFLEKRPDPELLYLKAKLPLPPVEESSHEFHQHGTGGRPRASTGQSKRDCEDQQGGEPTGEGSRGPLVHSQPHPPNPRQTRTVMDRDGGGAPPSPLHLGAEKQWTGLNQETGSTRANPLALPSMTPRCFGRLSARPALGFQNLTQLSWSRPSLAKPETRFLACMVLGHHLSAGPG